MCEIIKIQGRITLTFKVVKMGNDLCVVITGGGSPTFGGCCS